MRLLRLKHPDALTPDGQLQPDAVILSGTEYKQYQHDAKLLKEYKAMKQAREQALKDRAAEKYPSLYDRCGNMLGPDGKVYDPQDWIDKK